jgi:hypothetical protein
MPELDNRTPDEIGLSPAQIAQLQKAFENQPADVLRGSHAEIFPDSETSATKKKPKPKAKPRPKAKAKNEVV